MKMNGKELLKKLDPEIRKALKETPEEEWIKGYKMVKESEKRRLLLHSRIEVKMKKKLLQHML